MQNLQIYCKVGLRFTNLKISPPLSIEIFLYVLKNLPIMKALVTILKKALLIGMFASFFSVANLVAQDLLPPDNVGDLQELPLRFNVDTDVVDWNAYTLFQFEGAALARVENPDKSGINTTDFVVRYAKATGQAWAGFFYETDEIMSIGENSVFRLKVWSPRANVQALFKAEMRAASDVTTGDVFTTIPVANQWVQLEWDLSGFADELGDAPLDRVVVIMDLPGGAGDGSDNFVWYLDDFEFIADASTSVERNENEIPVSLGLNQNYPNPFNPTTNIIFDLPNSGFATLEVFNMIGQRVSVLVNENLGAGQYTATFDASNLSSGVYIYRLQMGNEVLMRKMTLIK